MAGRLKEAYSLICNPSEVLRENNNLENIQMYIIMENFKQTIIGKIEQ